jgi:type IV secretion system protein TrbL
MVTLFLVPDIAMAGTSTGALTTVQNDLQSVISQWYSPLQAAAKDLFFAFAAVEIAILAMNHGLNRKGHEDLFGSLIKKVVTLGFFLTCIDQANVWIPAIINGLEGGVSALGVTVATPSTIAGFAEKAFFAILLAPIHAAEKNASSILSDVLDLDWTAAFSSAETFFKASNPTSLLAEMILCFVIGILTFISIMMLALELLMVTLESYLVIAFGVIVLAGGGLRYTAKYVSSYFDYAVNVGFRLLMINAIAYLVMSSMVPLMTTMMTNVVNPLQMGIQMLALGAIIALLPKKASSIATSILTGSSSFSGGELAKGMATAGVGAVAVAAAPVALAAAGGAAAGGMAAGSMGASMGGGAAASGGGGALMGATEAAQAGGAAAQGGAGSMSAGMGGSGGGAGSMESASMKSVPTPDAKGMEHMRASVQKPSASGSSTNSKSNDAPPPAETAAQGTTAAQSTEGGSESPIAEAAEAAGVAGVAGVTAEAATAMGGRSAAQGTTAAKGASATQASGTATSAPKGSPAAQTSGHAASTAGSSPSAGPSSGPAGDSSASGGGKSSGGGESAPSESPSGSLPPIDAAPVPAPSPNEQTELLRQMRDSMAQQNRQPSLTEQAANMGKKQIGERLINEVKDHGKDNGGVSGSKLDFKHMDD